MKLKSEKFDLKDFENLLSLSIDNKQSKAIKIKDQYFPEIREDAITYFKFEEEEDSIEIIDERSLEKSNYYIMIDK